MDANLAKAYAGYSGPRPASVIRVEQTEIVISVVLFTAWEALCAPPLHVLCPLQPACLHSSAQVKGPCLVF